MADSPYSLAEVIAAQSELMRQISEQTRYTQETLMATLRHIGEERDRSFRRNLSLIAELERLGLVDLAPVSPILAAFEEPKPDLASRAHQPSK